MVGSGTSVEVAREMGIQAWGLDLHSGQNAIRDSILGQVGQEVDLVVSHPPYGGLIKYAGNVWGDKPHADDLSHCKDDEDFHQKMQMVLLNQREATRSGGVYGALIGDWRRGSVYTCYMAEMITRMPRDELASVIIKAQRNCMSDSKSYGRMQFPMIVHEYLVLFSKKAKPTLILLSGLAREQQQRLHGTWKAIVRSVLVQLQGRAPLAAIYDAVAKGAPERLSSNPSWQAKVRQVLNSNASDF
jgi:hypothetical protein